jgi:hypothetical protein
MQRVWIGGATRWTMVALALLSGGALAAEVTGEPHVSSISPVFHQLVAFSLPPEFMSQKATYERNSGSFYIREHVPEGETVDKWSRMITLTGARDLASNPNATPQAMLERMVAGFRRHCPDTFSAVVPGAQTVDGFQAFEVIAGCGHIGSGSDVYSEAAIMLAIKGSADYYTLQWAERGRDSPHPPTLDATYWTRQLARLSPIRLCPIVPGESAPYPSCAGR